MIKDAKVDVNVLKELYKILHKAYPIIDRDNVKLLSIGFGKELQSTTGLSKDMLKQFFKWYCNIDYRKLVKIGVSRYNLQGEIVGVVTENEEEHANNFIIYFNKNRNKKYNEEFTRVLELRKQYRIEEFAKVLELRKQYRNKSKNTIIEKT